MAPARLPLRNLLSKIGGALRPLSSIGTLAIMGIAFWLVWRALREQPAALIFAALAATPASAVAAAIACTLLSYAGLATGEWISFWVAARRLPAAPTIRSSVLATALSAAMGFGLASGPALRVRLYRWSGLSAKEILGASLLLSASTYLSGVVAMGLFVLLDLPGLSATLGLSRATAAVAGGVMLLPALLWFGMFRGPERPAMGARTAALAAALGDWLFSGLALFVLSPQPLSGLPAFMTVFCLGSLIGAIAGVPASLGVLDAAVLHLHAAGMVHERAAALILYRAVYFLGPLLLALAYLSLRFLRSRWRAV